MISHINNYGPNPNAVKNIITNSINTIPNLKNINICISKLDAEQETMESILGKNYYKKFRNNRTIIINNNIKLNLLLPNNINHTNEVSLYIGLYMSFDDYKKNIIDNLKLHGQNKIYIPWSKNDSTLYNQNYPQSTLIKEINE